MPFLLDHLVSLWLCPLPSLRVREYTRQLFTSHLHFFSLPAFSLAQDFQLGTDAKLVLAGNSIGLQRLLVNLFSLFLLALLLIDPADQKIRCEGNSEGRCVLACLVGRGQEGVKSTFDVCIFRR